MSQRSVSSVSGGSSSSILIVKKILRYWTTAMMMMMLLMFAAVFTITITTKTAYGFVIMQPSSLQHHHVDRGGGGGGCPRGGGGGDTDSLLLPVVVQKRRQHHHDHHRMAPSVASSSSSIAAASTTTTTTNNDELKATTTAMNPPPPADDDDDTMITDEVATTTTPTPVSTSEEEEQQERDVVVVNDDDDDDDDDEEAAFLRRCRELCNERNIPFDKIKNARDLSSARNSPIISNRVYRMGRVSDATTSDIQTLMKDIGIKTLIDLRSPTELKDDPTLMREEVFADFTNMVWKEQGGSAGRQSNNNNNGSDHAGGCLLELPAGVSPAVRKRKRDRIQQFISNSIGNLNNSRKRSSSMGGRPSKINNVDFDVNGVNDGSLDDKVGDMEDTDDSELCGIDSVSSSGSYYDGIRKERHFVSLMNEFKYVKGTVSRLRKRDITKAILKSPGALVSKRMRTSIKKPFITEINDGGLPMLNELLLRFGSPGIRYVLELCADERRHPIAFYCTAGKDRTGILAAILLAICNTPTDSIVEDYTLSANVYAEMNDHTAMVGALSQRNLDPKTFLGAPPDVMEEVLMDINDIYGSMDNYCDWIGFHIQKRQQLRNALMK